MNSHEPTSSQPVPTVAPCHVSVMTDEVVQWLRPQSCSVLLDGTFGAGGHSQALATRMAAGGRVIAIDRDPAALEAMVVPAAITWTDLPLVVHNLSYHHAAEVLAEEQVAAVDGIVLDLGLSSDQLADRQRGFSFSADGPLDLRFDPRQGQTARDFLAQSTEKEIADAIYQFGEERYSRRIAKQIVLRRSQKQPVKTVSELVEICRRCVPRAKNHDIHPATRTFQALRIAVNHELQILAAALRDLPEILAPGGRFVVISFHSLEDRMVKQAFRDDARLEVLTRKPLRPTDAEVAANPRSRSAKMRVAEKREAASDELRF